jgi:AraC family ethanolamine operon transcriptional activator
MSANPPVPFPDCVAPSIVVSTEVHDTDAMAACIEDGLTGECVQLESGPFSARWMVLRLRTLILQFSREDVAAVHRFRVPDDRWAFVVPVRVPDGVRWDGHAVSQDTAILCPPRSESFVFHPGGTELAVVSAGLEVAAELVEGVSEKLGLSSACRVVRPFPSDLGSLASNVAALRTAAEFRPDAISSEVARRADGFVKHGLRRCLLGAVAGEAVREGRSRSSIVRRVEEFFRDHVDESVSMTRLSSIAGVSERSLRNAFYRVCATSPKKYLRIWQLHQVRRSLRSAPGGPSAVTSVATQHGFYELGRFAGEYRKMFGEAPSETLHKARLRPPLLPARWPVVPAS